MKYIRLFFLLFLTCSIYSSSHEDEINKVYSTIGNDSYGEFIAYRICKVYSSRKNERTYFFHSYIKRYINEVKKNRECTYHILTSIGKNPKLIFGEEITEVQNLINFQEPSYNELVITYFTQKCNEAIANF